MSKLIDVRVTTVTAELNLLIPSKSIGKSLFDKIIITLGLQETWYFGLVYVDVNGFHRWLKMDKKISKINVKDKKLLKFNFLVKYYPEDVATELIQNITISLFYFQVRENILHGNIYCPPETALLLASLSCQVKFGDYDPVVHKPGSFLHERILADRIINQYRWSLDQWEETVIKWYSELSGMFPEEAMLEYLKLCQDLEMYGVSYFLITNKKSSNLYLGIDAFGMNIYKSTDRLTPMVGFPWSEIRNISFNDKKFVIKSIDKKAPDFVFYTQEPKVNKNILALCSGNHELCVRRSKADSLDVKQMKAQVLQDRITKAREREQLLKEKMSKEEAKRRLQILEENLRKETLELANTKEVMESCFDNCEDILKKIELKKCDKTLESDLENLEYESKGDDIRYHGDKDVVMRKQDMNDDFKIPKTKVILSIVPETQDIESKEYDHTMSTMRPSFEYATGMGRRRTLIEISVSIQERLKELEIELKDVKIPKPVDEFDGLHQQKKAQGLDKFQTLKQIRLGNTKKRVDTFESL